MAEAGLVDGGQRVSVWLTLCRLIDARQGIGNTDQRIGLQKEPVDTDPATYLNGDGATADSRLTQLEMDFHSDPIDAPKGQ
jgi:hypothetical protein